MSTLTETMTGPVLVDRDTWLKARVDLLRREKAHLREKDQLAEARRALPMVRVETQYVFDTEEGRKSLADLFAGRGQLVVYHFMLGDGWAAGCPSCSFWADSFDGTDVHLAARNTTFLCVSSAPLDQIRAYRARMGWRFEWVSADGSTFNQDYGVTFPGRAPAGPTGGYNYTSTLIGEEMPGISVFARLPDGGVAHAYSTYGRGIEGVNAAYQLLDMTPWGRHEEGLSHTMAWVRRHDEYDAA